MNVFTSYSAGYIDELKNNWDITVENKDVVLISDDISWAMYKDHRYGFHRSSRSFYFTNNIWFTAIGIITIRAARTVFHCHLLCIPFIGLSNQLLSETSTKGSLDFSLKDSRNEQRTFNGTFNI